MISYINWSEKINYKTLFIKIFLVLVVFMILFFSVNKSEKKVFTNSPEIEKIKLTKDIKTQVSLYKDLIDRVGAEEAQDELYRSGLPFTGQTHLLNHEVGDYLYEKYGNKGLVQCRDYFLSSCYHGFILNVIADSGMDGIADVFKECLKSGPTVSTQCAHGIGHGFLANAGYKNLTEALESCDIALKNIKGFPAFNCYDGVFMENIWAVHDGEPSKDRWVKEDDDKYPCDDKRINKKYLLGCWSNQPALAYQLHKGDLSKVVNLCNSVENPEYKNMCFDGLSRQIHPITDGQIKKVFNLCNIMGDNKWIYYCLSVNSSSSYAVGDREISFDICSKVDDDGKSVCYNRLISTIKSYSKSQNDTVQMCSKIKEKDWKDICLNK